MGHGPIRYLSYLYVSFSLPVKATPAAGKKSKRPVDDGQGHRRLYHQLANLESFMIPAYDATSKESEETTDAKRLN